MDGSQNLDDPLDVGWRDGPPTLQSVVAMVRRQSLLMLICILTGIVVAFVVIIFVQPTYTARVSMYLDANGGAGEPRSEVTTGIDLDTTVELIQADDTLASVVRALDLLDAPEFAPKSSALNATLARMRTMLGVTPASDGPADPLPAVILKLRSGLDVARNGNTRVIDLTYTSTSPARAAAIANAIADAYLASVAARDERSVTRRIERLDERTNDMRQKVLDIGTRIRTNLRASGQINVAPQEIEQQTFGLREQVSALEAKVAALSAKLELFAAYERTGDVTDVAIDTPISRRLLTELEAAERRLIRIRQTTDAESEVASVTESGIEVLQESLRQEIRIAAKAIEVERNMTIAEQENIASQIARLGEYLGSDGWAELESLRQEKMLYEGMYQDYLTQLEDAGRDRQGRSDLRIVAEAQTPTIPASPNTKVLLAIMLTFAAFIGVGIAGIREWNRHEPTQA